MPGAGLLALPSTQGRHWIVMTKTDSDTLPKTRRQQLWSNLQRQHQCGKWTDCFCKSAVFLPDLSEAVRSRKDKGRKSEVKWAEENNGAKDTKYLVIKLSSFSSSKHRSLSVKTKKERDFICHSYSGRDLTVIHSLKTPIKHEFIQPWIKWSVKITSSWWWRL